MKKQPTRKQLAARRKFALMAKARSKAAKLAKRTAVTKKKATGARKNPTRKQLAWRKKFAAMSRARAKAARGKKRTGKRNPAYKGYLIKTTLTGEYFFEKSGHLIGWAKSEADAKKKIDTLVQGNPKKGSTAKRLVTHKRKARRNSGSFLVTAFYSDGQYQVPKEKGSYSTLSEAKAAADRVAKEGKPSASGMRLVKVTVSVGGGSALYTAKKNPFAKIKGRKVAQHKSTKKRITRGAKRAAKKRVASKRKAHSAYLRGGYADLGGGRSYQRKVSGLHKSSNPRRRRRNSATDDKLHSFRGRPTSEVLDVTVPSNAPSDLYCLGILTGIETEKETFEFTEREKVYLAADADDNLYIVNGPRINPGNDDLGEIEHISYVVKKDHLGGGVTEWTHEFGEEGGERPSLIIDREGLFEIVGGDYTISAAGIEG